MAHVTDRSSPRVERFSHACQIWGIHSSVSYITGVSEMGPLRIYTRANILYSLPPAPLLPILHLALLVVLRVLDVDPNNRKPSSLHTLPNPQPPMPGLVSDATRIWEQNVYWPLGSQCGVWDSKTKGVDVWECIRPHTASSSSAPPNPRYWRYVTRR